MTIGLTQKACIFGLAMLWCALRVWRGVCEHPDGWRLRSRLGIVFFWSFMTLSAAILWYIVWPDIANFLLVFGVLFAAQLFESRFSGSRRQAAETAATAVIIAICAGGFAALKLIGIGHESRRNLVEAAIAVIIFAACSSISVRSFLRLRKVRPA